MNSPSPFTRIAILGDLHGHLQLGLCALARIQRESQIPISAVLLAGDVGTFTTSDQLDSATRSHAKDNLCELEFLTQWSHFPFPPWLAAIFEPAPYGLGLTCPVIMVHGNHEGFAHLASLNNPRRQPKIPARVSQLPTVDSGERIHYLPSGWIVKLETGQTIAGVGGMEAGQRRSKYHPLAYIDDDAVNRLLGASPVDILLTHQGPAALQNDHGSPTLDVLLERLFARFWFHGHSTPIIEPSQIEQTLIVPLGDLAFVNSGKRRGELGLDGWCLLDLYPDGTHQLHRDPPVFWRELRRNHWRVLPGNVFVHPDLGDWIGSVAS